MGFIPDIRRVIKLLPAKRQNLLFSATFSGEIRTLAKGMLDNPAEVEVAPRNTASELVTQSVHLVAKARKRALLSLSDRLEPLAAGAGLHQDQARRQPAGRAARQGRHRGDGHPRQQEPGRPHPGAVAVQGRLAAGAGGHRHRGARPRHRRAAARRQLRAAARAGGLRPPHRPYRPRRPRRLRPCRWSIARRSSCSTAIERLIKRPIERVEVDGFTGLDARPGDAELAPGPRRPSAAQPPRQSARRAARRQRPQLCRRARAAAPAPQSACAARGASRSAQPSRQDRAALPAARARGTAGGKCSARTPFAAARRPLGAGPRAARAALADGRRSAACRTAAGAQLSRRATACRRRRCTGRCWSSPAASACRSSMPR